MTKSNKIKFKVVPRRMSTIYRAAPWILSFRVEGHCLVEVRFMASGGGNAKYKTLPKLQGELMAISDGQRNPRIRDLVLKKAGGGDAEAPVYTLCKWCASLQMIMKTGSPSRVFRIKNNGCGGNGRC